MHASERTRTVIEKIYPSIDCGRFPVKRVTGETVRIQADIFADGHERVRCVLADKPPGIEQWLEREMRFVDNDRWEGRFTVDALGRHAYTIAAWVDHFGGWREGLAKKVKAGLDVALEVLSGAELVEAAARRAAGTAQPAPLGDDPPHYDSALRKREASRLTELAERLANTTIPIGQRIELALSNELRDLAMRYPDRSHETRLEHPLWVTVDRERAGFSSWYEMFPRSASSDPGRHGTFRDCERLLPYVAEMGFDVLYFPPIHPIGVTKRKGRNNRLEPAPDDPGSPWAIGGAEGGHTAIHPELGTQEEFERLVRRAREHGLEIALDIAFQCSPDHPWVTEHPEWFTIRPDGSVQFAENPPKKYEDIYPLNFESEDWENLWRALRDVFLHWIKAGVTIFRVDNPHTKSFPFWEWVIDELKREHPETIFLSEAFTRPKVMYQLAKLGFTQSYTYFTWRNNASEMRAYLEELTTTEAIEFFRPNFWPNTPDILHADLQNGGRPAFVVRLVLAATLSSNYGIYGPAFELLENTPREPGSEEYLDSEKYEIKDWNRDDPKSLRPIITTLNHARKEHSALQRNDTLRFHPTDNPQILAYSKHSPDLESVMLMVVSFDYRYPQSGWLEFGPSKVGVKSTNQYMVYDLLTDQGYRWQDGWNYVELRPADGPVHVFRVIPLGQDDDLGDSSW